MKQFTIPDRFIHSLRRKFADTINGLDMQVVSVAAFKRFINRPAHGLDTLFTSEELMHYKDRLDSLAGRFAAKKALRNALQKNISFTDITILSSETGKPVVFLHDVQETNISLSISHDGDMAAAFALSTAKNQTGKNIQVGIDIALSARLLQFREQHEQYIYTTLLTPPEWEEAKHDIRKFAEKWTGKEAVSKTIGTGISQGVSFQDIEIITQNNQPQVKLSGAARKHAAAQMLHQVKISCLHTHDAVFAFVIASG